MFGSLQIGLKLSQKRTEQLYNNCFFGANFLSIFISVTCLLPYCLSPLNILWYKHVIFYLLHQVCGYTFQRHGIFNIQCFECLVPGSQQHFLLDHCVHFCTTDDSLSVSGSGEVWHKKYANKQTLMDGVGLYMGFVRYSSTSSMFRNGLHKSS